MSLDLFAPELNEALWYVLHTKSRHEKKVAEDLGALKVPHFLPLIETVRFYGKRKFKVAEPLFPGYVFLRGNLEQAFAADRTKRIAQILHVANQEQMTWELKNLAIALDQQIPLDPYPFLKEGVRVEVKSGPFRGLQGLVESRKAWDRLILEIDMLGRAVSMEIDGSLLEPI
jgi:transcription antitermination factor NusG